MEILNNIPKNISTEEFNSLSKTNKQFFFQSTKGYTKYPECKYGLPESSNGCAWSGYCFKPNSKCYLGK